MVLVCSNPLFFTCKWFSQLVRLLIVSRFYLFCLKCRATFENEDDFNRQTIFSISLKEESRRLLIIIKIKFSGFDIDYGLSNIPLYL